MPIANYTTKINRAASLQEIQKLLAKAGAKRILTDYDQEGEVAAISFQLQFGHQLAAFRLPLNTEGVKRVLTAQKVDTRYRTTEHARNVATRIVKDWLRAQLAIVEAEQATFAQLMLPHALFQDGRTLAETFEQDGPSQYLLSGPTGRP